MLKLSLFWYILPLLLGFTILRGYYMKRYTIQMLFMRLIYSIFKSFVLIFVNIYLWKTGKSIDAVALFNIFNYLGATLSFYLGNIIALKNTKYNYLLSSISFISLFALTAIYGDKISTISMLIGILGGFGDGFFFFNLNTFQASELDKNEMDRFMSLLGIISKVSSILTPGISGLIIYNYGFMTMIYVLIFLVTLQFVNSLFMPNSKTEAMAKINFKAIKNNKHFRNTIATHCIRAPYSQFSIVANSVFIYYFAKSELQTGYLNSFFAIASVILFMIYQFSQKKVSRKRLMLIGAIAHSLAMLLLFKPTLITFVIYSLSLSIGGAFFGHPLTGLQIHTSKKYSNSQEEMLGNLISRVFMLTAGRVSFFVLLLLFYKDFNSPIYYVFLVYNVGIPLVSYWLVKEEI